jgi:hypothetical protein
MGPVVPEFVLVGNGYNHENQVDYVDHNFSRYKARKKNNKLMVVYQIPIKKLVSEN